MKILVSMQERDCYFYGCLTGWRRYEQWLRTAYCRPLKKWFAYVYIPWLGRQLSLDVWF